MVYFVHLTSNVQSLTSASLQHGLQPCHPNREPFQRYSLYTGLAQRVPHETIALVAGFERNIGDCGELRSKGSLLVDALGGVRQHLGIGWSASDRKPLNKNLPFVPARAHT